MRHLLGLSDQEQDLTEGYKRVVWVLLNERRKYALAVSDVASVERTCIDGRAALILFCQSAKSGTYNEEILIRPRFLYVYRSERSM